jgi:hypothetical protein
MSTRLSKVDINNKMAITAARTPLSSDGLMYVDKEVDDVRVSLSG